MALKPAGGTTPNLVTDRRSLISPIWALLHNSRTQGTLNPTKHRRSGGLEPNNGSTVRTIGKGPGFEQIAPPRSVSCPASPTDLLPRHPQTSPVSHLPIGIPRPSSAPFRQNEKSRQSLGSFVVTPPAITPFAPLHPPALQSPNAPSRPAASYASPSQSRKGWGSSPPPIPGRPIGVQPG